jgi:hypothetical protein
MENPKINIPLDEIFKVFLLDSNSKIKKIIVFSGNENPNIKNSELFSDNELNDIHNDNPQIIYSKQLLHYDDSIINVKTKIINDLGTHTMSYYEMYMFSIIKEKINLLNFYNEITKSNEIKFTQDMLNQLFINLDIDNSIINEIPSKDNYDYEDLIKLNIDNGEHRIKTSIGQRFIRNKNYLFAANPYDIIGLSTNVFENNLFFDSIHESFCFLNISLTSFIGVLRINRAADPVTIRATIQVFNPLIGRVLYHPIYLLNSRQLNQFYSQPLDHRISRPRKLENICICIRTSP